MIRMGIIGLGHWGPNLERNFLNFPDTELTAVCDLDDARLERANTSNPNVYKTKRCKGIT